MKTFLKILIGIIILIVLGLGGLCLGIYLKTNENPIVYITAFLHIGIENKELTSENFEEIIKEYTEDKGDSDEVWYLMYECLRYTLQNTMSSEPYEKMYGMTINELIKEGKEDMEAEETTVEEFKNSIQELQENIQEFNNQMNSSLE